jgi:primase-polymerase (primpol)-like protein
MISCEVCGEALAKPARGRVPRFCGTRCRVASHRQQQRFYVPEELKDHDRWIRHKDKRPLALKGYYLSIHDDTQWATFDQARNCTKGDGIGFVLNGDGIVCIDLDDCVQRGRVNQKAQALIDSLPKTFVEISPSGKGVHIWGYGNIEGGRKFERDGLKIEVYGTGRYLTVSGNTYTRASLAKLNLDELVG